jgi:perosamine synthetase
MPCDLPAILAFAERLGIPVIEDAACAAGSEIQIDGAWERIGRPRGVAACFSFHPRKVITTGDGGMITTRDPELDRRFRLQRQHGMSLPDTARHGAKQVVFEEYLEPAYNYRLTDLQAAVGRVQLQRLPELVERRRNLAANYRAKLAQAIPGIGLPVEPDWARSNWQSYCVRLPDGVDQRGAMQHLLDRGVSTRRGVMCSHLEPAYSQGGWSCGAPPACGCPKGGCLRLTESEQAMRQCMILPLFHELTDEQMSQVVNTLAEACRACRA